MTGKPPIEQCVRSSMNTCTQGMAERMESGQGLDASAQAHPPLPHTLSAQFVPPTALKTMFCLPTVMGNITCSTCHAMHPAGPHLIHVPLLCRLPLLKLPGVGAVGPHQPAGPGVVQLHTKGMRVGRGLRSHEKLVLNCWHFELPLGHTGRLAQV